MGFAYIYFDHKKAQTLTPADYLASLVGQLEEQKEGLCPSIQSAYEKLPSKSQRPDFQSLKSFLSDSAEYFSAGTYIILDAFDECSENGRKALVELLDSFNRLDTSTHPNRFRFFIASRPNSSIDSLASMFEDQVRIIELIAGKGEQTQDLKDFVDDTLSREKLSDQEKSFILTGIIQKAQGL